MSKITKIKLTEFSFDVPNIGLETAAAGVGNMAWIKDGLFKAKRFAVKIESNHDATGEYVANWVSTPSSFAQAGMLAPLLLGKDPECRERLYDDLKREVRAYDHMGHGVLDIALWDLVGKLKDVSVKTMLGGFRDRLPTYASSYCGQESVGWMDGDVKREMQNLRGVRKRIGDDWHLMIDPASMLNSWNDALALGKVCDEVNCLWYEDPYKDSSVSAYGHQRLREKLKTPLLVSEHVRGLEQKASFLLAGGCDMIHADPEYDMGITGVMKIAHFSEALGLDLQIHAVGPAHRLCMSAIRNTKLYEMALIGPGMPNIVAPVYASDYSDQAEDLPPDGCVEVPSGKGIGVLYDWDFIKNHTTQEMVFE